MRFVWAILIGLLAGWIAGKIWKGSGFGILGNLIVGVIGSVLGGFVARLLQLGPQGLLGELIVAVFGAILFLWLVNYFSKKQ